MQLATSIRSILLPVSKVGLYLVLSEFDIQDCLHMRYEERVVTMLRKDARDTQEGMVDTLSGPI